MRKLLLLVSIMCLFLQLPAQAAEPVKVSTFLMSMQAPAGWTVDADEFRTQAYPFIEHILRPVMIWAENEQYSLLASVYDFDSDTQHAIGNAPDKDLACFNALVQYSGLVPGDGKLLPIRRSAPADNRDFFFGKTTDGRCIATYRSKQLRYCYAFQLTPKDSSISVEDTQAQLLEIITTLREVGIFYPNDAPDAMVVITSDSANIRASASADGHRVKTARQGDVFPCLGQEDGWYLIGVGESICYVSMSHARIK